MSDPALAPALRCEGLVRRIADAEIVAGVSLTIGAAESVSLVGPSGCGKTTLLQMLGLLDRPTAGTVHLGEESAWTLDAAGRAWLRLRHIGFVFQQNNLLAHLTLRDNVALPAWRMSGSRQAALAAADELLERFALGHRAGARAAVLSGGESQRGAIARALINRPLLLLADEPTGSLDARSATLVWSALEEVRRHGTALLVVTHDPAVAARTQRQLSMAEGTITERR